MAGPRLRAFREQLLFGALRVVSFFGQRIPLRLGQRIGRAIGSLAYSVAIRERNKAMANMAIAFPEWSAAERRRVARAMFRHLGSSLFEIVWLPNLDEKRRNETTTLENAEPTLEMVKSGRAIVTFTAHCGNWEWLAYVCGSLMPVTALQRERTEEGLGDFITNMRARVGIRTIERGTGNAGRELVRAMRRPGLVAFLIDQSIRAESAKVPFFGHPALTPIGPATLAIRTGAAVVLILIERRPDGTHHARFSDPIETRRGDDPIELTARITRGIEEQIRRVPEQWVWMHDRWRDRPKWDVGQRHASDEIINESNR